MSTMHTACIYYIIMEKLLFHNYEDYIEHLSRILCAVSP